MLDMRVILSIDQGTTSSRTLVFKPNGELLYTAQKAFPQIYPQDGWVEHDPENIWDSVIETLQRAAKFCHDNDLSIAGIGITNQRETTIIWDRKTGKPLYNAVVWQDRRTADICKDLKDAGHETEIRSKTGLVLDPYFSASKAARILDTVKGARKKAEAGDLAFGTVDSFLIWRLTGGKTHATDGTNASRTSLFNAKKYNWDKELADIFNVPLSILPEVKDCADDYGHVDSNILPGHIPICGVAGDQQAALIGQNCFKPGELKSTYGTGCFIVTNTGQDFIQSDNNLLTTIGYRLKGQTTFALEGSIFVAGAAIQWLRDGLALFENAGDTAKLAIAAENNPDLYLVPAFTGLGAPHWDPHARGAIFGLTRAATRADIVRAALEGIAFQTHDLLSSMSRDGVKISALRVDGGMVANDWFLQSLANITNITVERPDMLETPALGAAQLAAMKLGLTAYPDDMTVKNKSMLKRMKPNWSADVRTKRISRWSRAVEATQHFAKK